MGGARAFRTYVELICVVNNASQLGPHAKQCVLRALICWKLELNIRLFEDFPFGVK